MHFNEFQLIDPGDFEVELPQAASDGAQLPASGSSSEQVSVVEVDEAHDEVL